MVEATTMIFPPGNFLSCKKTVGSHLQSVEEGALLPPPPFTKLSCSIREPGTDVTALVNFTEKRGSNESSSSVRSETANDEDFVTSAFNLLVEKPLPACTASDI